MSKVCTECGGSGKVPDGFPRMKKCPTCHGGGFIRQEVTIVGAPHPTAHGDIEDGFADIFARMSGSGHVINEER